jgi:quinol monooxygenase YgiN
MLPVITGRINQNHMIRYFMTFNVPQSRLQAALKIIENYFDELDGGGPGGMRSQCYTAGDKDYQFVHIEGFKKESVANKHFASRIFREYIHQLSAVCETPPSFSRLQQQHTFESIY